MKQNKEEHTVKVINLRKTVTEDFDKFGCDSNQWDAFVMGWCAANNVSIEACFDLILLGRY